MKMKSLKITKASPAEPEVLVGVFEVNEEILPLSVDSKTSPGTYNECLSIIGEVSKGSIQEDEAAELILDLMRPATRIEKVIEDVIINDELVLKNGALYFAGNKLEDTLSKYVLSLIDANTAEPLDADEWESVLKFLDKLYQNADSDIRENLFRWMNYELNNNTGINITSEGNIVGYKGCSGTILAPTSINTGSAYVDGVLITGSIPNPLGSVITMPRSKVEHDPERGCSAGLHVGTYAYASAWGPILLLVEVNPRDIVSVPYECDSQKMRVCEYRVLDITEGPLDQGQIYQTIEIEYDTPKYAVADKYSMELNDDENVVITRNEDNAYQWTIDFNEPCITTIEYLSKDGAYTKQLNAIVTDVAYDEETREVTGLIVRNADDLSDVRHIKVPRIDYI